MGAFDKKKAFGIGGIVGAIAVLANLLQIIDLVVGLPIFNKPEKNETSTSIMETVEKNTKEPEVIEDNYAEVVEEVPPTEPKPVSVYINDLQYMSCKNCVKEQDNLTDNVGNMYHKGLFMDNRPNGIDPYRYEGSVDY